MSPKRVLVTGSTGFIGINLVKTLLAAGHKVTALVRATSDTSELQQLGVNLIEADFGDAKSLKKAVAQQQVIYHLAAVTRAVSLATFKEVNLDGFRNLLSAAIASDQDPKLVFVSSLAAMGPSAKEVAHCESVTAKPLSNYGKRPPIVIGPHDRKGFELFRTINQLGVHFIPGFNKSVCSVIHVSDLCAALMAVAQHGRRLTPDNPENGTYLAAADEIVTYNELGAMIGLAMGRQSTTNVPIPRPVLKLIGGVNTFVGNLRGSPLFLNYDKVRDVTGGSWACNNSKLKQETGFSCPTPLATRIAQVVKWYRNEGWLPNADTIGAQPATSVNVRHNPNEPTMKVN